MMIRSFTRTMTRWSLIGGCLALSVVAPQASHAAPITPQTYGAVGDGVHDDTAAIQSAINALPSAGSLYFSYGTYRITAALTIPFMTGKKIYGENLGTTIRQDTNNVPIFQTTTQDTHSMELSDLTLAYKNQQATANTNAVAVDFTEPSNSGDGFYYWHINRLWIQGANVGIGITGAAGTYVPLWTTSIKDVVMTGITHSGLQLVSPHTIGMPNILVDNLTIKDGGAIAPNGPAINLSAVQFTARGLDIEQWANTAFFELGGTQADLSDVHIEHHVFNSGAPLFEMANGPLTVSHVSISTDVNPTTSINLFYAFAGASMFLHDIQTYVLPATSGTIHLVGKDATVTTLTVDGFQDRTSPSDVIYP